MAVPELQDLLSGKAVYRPEDLEECEENPPDGGDGDPSSAPKRPKARKKMAKAGKNKGKTPKSLAPEEGPEPEQQPSVAPPEQAAPNPCGESERSDEQMNDAVADRESCMPGVASSECQKILDSFKG
jgi:hypothetical protein